MGLPFHVMLYAFTNLFDNSIRAMERGGEIRVEAREVDTHVECIVADTGPGIPEGIRSRIFELGFTTKPKSGGWGLYLVRRSLMEKGGSISLMEQDGPGTAFLLRLPKYRR